MRKIGIRALICLMAFSVGVSLTFYLTDHTGTLPASARSCQMKHILTDGSIVWTPCN